VVLEPALEPVGGSYLPACFGARQNRQRENTQQRNDSAHMYTQPTQLTPLEHRLQPTTPLTGQGGPAAHCSMYPSKY